MEWVSTCLLCFIHQEFIVLIILLFHSLGSVQSRGFSLVDLIVNRTYFVISFQDYSFIVHRNATEFACWLYLLLLHRYDLIILRELLLYMKHFVYPIHEPGSTVNHLVTVLLYLQWGWPSPVYFLIVPANTFSTMLERSEQSKHSCCAPHLCV